MFARGFFWLIDTGWLMGDPFVLLALAKVFGLKTVAEGVETDRHFQVLKDMGCQVAQGYGIARPMPEKQFFEWYLANLSKASP